MDRTVGNFTIACRYLCSALVAAPILYWISVTDGDAYHFLALVVLAPVAGLLLIANSLFRLVRHRTWRSAASDLFFIVFGSVGFLSAWHFLPQFRM